MITWDDVALIAPELADLDEDVQDAILADVALELDADAWGTHFDMASKYLAAHKASMRGRGGAGAQVTSESVGQVSRSYAVSGSGTDLDSTSYGQDFDRLAKKNPAFRFSIALN
jgi:hypothetical protein